MTEPSKQATIRISETEADLHIEATFDPSLTEGQKDGTEELGYAYGLAVSVLQSLEAILNSLPAEEEQEGSFKFPDESDSPMDAIRDAQAGLSGVDPHDLDPTP